MWVIPSHTDKQTIYKCVRLIHTRLGRMISSCRTRLFQTKRLRARLMIHIKTYFSVKESTQKTVFVFRVWGKTNRACYAREREKERAREGRTQKEKVGTRESKQSEERYVISLRNTCKSTAPYDAVPSGRPGGPGRTAPSAGPGMLLAAITQHAQSPKDKDAGNTEPYRESIGLEFMRCLSLLCG